MATFSPPKLTLAQEKKQRERRWKEKLVMLKMKEEIYKHHALAPEYRPRITDPSPLWREFVRQRQAFSFAATFKEDLHVFAVDMDESGQRRYIVTSYPQLRHTVFHWHGSEPPHFYEIIPEGAACHLYFDIEYSTEHNPESDGIQMVNTFIQCVCHYLREMYDIQCDRRNIIDLDATTEKKFSRHLIFRLPDAAFRDNIHAGCFVHHVCTALANHARNRTSNDSNGTDDITNAKSEKMQGSSPKAKKLKLDDEGEESDILSKLDLDQLFVYNKGGEKVIFVDQGVYTRNRNFRLYKCAKKGKENVFKLSKENQYKPKFQRNSRTPVEYQIFVDSIVSNVNFSSKLRILDCEGEYVRRSIRLQNKSDPDADTVSGSAVKTPTKSQDVVEGFKQSPYPELDGFIRTQINKGGVQGEIRRWTYFANGELIVYDICKNRWCENIGRQHKSNNIMILVDLKQGVYYQKCHDQDCKSQNFKSPDQPVPFEYLPSFYDDIDDEELLKALEQMEESGGCRSDGNDEEIDENDLDDETLLRAAEVYEQQQEGGV